jgi:endoglucanase
MGCRDVMRIRWLFLLCTASPSIHAQPSAAHSFIRINQLGYLPDAPKTAIVCSLDSVPIKSFTVQDASGSVVFGPHVAKSSGSFGPCASTHRLDFSALRKSGRYTIVAGGAASPPVHIDPNTYAGAADTLLYYMRQQRSGFNPIIRDSVHTHDGIIVDHPTRTGEFIGHYEAWRHGSPTERAQLASFYRRGLAAVAA